MRKLNSLYLHLNSLLLRIFFKNRRWTKIPQTNADQPKLNGSLFLAFFKKYLFLFIYLAVPGLSCSTHCRGQDLQLWHTGSSSQTRDRTLDPPCTGSSETELLDNEGRPRLSLLTREPHCSTSICSTRGC